LPGAQPSVAVPVDEKDYAPSARFGGLNFFFVSRGVYVNSIDLGYTCGQKKSKGDIHIFFSRSE